VLGAAILGGIAGALLSTFFPLLLAAVRRRVPRWSSVLRITYIRTVFGAVFGLTAAAGISLSISDHSHREVTYFVWYGIAALALIGVLSTTILIDRRLGRTPPPSSEQPTSPNATMNRLIRQQWRELRGARAARKIPPESGAAATQPNITSALEEITDQTMRMLAGRTSTAPTQNEEMTRTRAEGEESSVEQKRKAAEKERAARVAEHGNKLLKAISAAKQRSMSMPDVFGEEAAAELTAHVESWRGEVGGYVLPKLDKGWRTTLAQLKLYVEKELGER
jgi:hypothetical protein